MKGRNEREASGERLENRTDFHQKAARLQRYVTGVGRSGPELGKRVDETRTRPDWPAWCFLPTGEIGRLSGGMREVCPGIRRQVERHRGACWMAGRSRRLQVRSGSLRFCLGYTAGHPDSGRGSVSPAGIVRLHHDPRMRVRRTKPRWLFAYLDYDAGSGRTELRLLPDLGEDHLFRRTLDLRERRRGANRLI
jgi:hypothetical protein